MTATCGDALCVFPKGHRGHFHAGPERADGTRYIWPTKAGRDEAAAAGINGRVLARLNSSGKLAVP